MNITYVLNHIIFQYLFSKSYLNY